MKLLTIIVLFVLNFLMANAAKFKFTNLKCVAYDEPFATIPVCKLNLVQRGVAAMDLYVKLHQGPVNNVTLHNQLLKKVNGYRPFLYNITNNFCRTMRNTKKYPYISIYTNMLAKYSNINHTCPYNHDIIVTRFVLKDEMFKFLPLPEGNYLVVMNVYAYNDLKATVKVYFSVN